ncbi:hypothetical protein GC173_07045 [bacterium]|nr:hypothetical protein [bacterium]
MSYFLKGVALGLATSVGTACMSSPKNVSMELTEIATLQEAGHLETAAARAKDLLDSKGLSAEQRRTIEYEIERSRRIAQDYRVTKERLWDAIEGGVADVTREEFEGWVAEGRFDSMTIDGKQLFVGPSLSNLFFRYPELMPRRIKKSPGRWGPFLLAHVREARAAGEQSVIETGPPKHFRITYTNTVEANAVPAGETIKCWMVYPQQMASQDGVVLESAEPQPKWINAPNYPVRSLYFEQPSRGAEPTTFSATYTVTTRPRYVPIDPARVAAVPQNGPDSDWFLREQPPHVQFTPELKALASEIVGDEQNPAVKARLIYDWVSANMRYSYAREYSTLHNISMYCYSNRYGDCGQIALLYMTLCRIAGVPARWQSGWVLYPGDENLHDWCEIWLAPYGWVAVDPNYGVFFAGPRSDTLTPEENRELKDFFFGGLDAYRLVINRDHGFPHFPPKEDFRSDNVDFQRGELEAGGKNLYFDQFDYDLKLEELETPGGEAPEEGEAQASVLKGPRTPGRVR